MSNSGRVRNHENFQKSIAALRKRALNVKFDLDDTDYTPLENIGSGAYGVVKSAVHKRTNDRVAIKKIPNVFEVKDIAKRTFREIKVLKHFKHDNIISIREILKPKETIDSFREIYVVFDLMESDLHRIIYSDQDLSNEHVRFFLYQLLRGLKYIHSANVIHRDLKPSNLLVNEDCRLCIGDFGMARGISASPEEPNYFMTQYVATRWYRAPEIMLSLIEYSGAVDMWSVGCIFAEMLGRRHLFPGKDYISQIRLIVGVLGSPSQSLMNLCQSDMVRKFFQEMGPKQPVPWKTLFPQASRQALDMLSKMLVLHPGERITAEKALKHPYLSKYHDPDDEPICVPAFNFDFEKEEMDKDKLRKVIYDEILEYYEQKTHSLSFPAFLRPAPKTPDKQQSPTSHNAPGTNQLESFLQQLNTDQASGPSIEGSEVNEKLQEVPVVQLQEADDGQARDHKVVVDTTNTLQLSAYTDVEMLSAKSEGRQEQLRTEIMSENESRLKNKENEPSDKKALLKKEYKSEENTTISMDTKALIKAALLNASLMRKRTDSTSDATDDSKSKPVTAAQRQREREDKRKKKLDKAKERAKKTKEKKGVEQTSPLLTEQDRELLMRWSKMQPGQTEPSTNTPTAVLRKSSNLKTETELQSHSSIIRIHEQCPVVTDQFPVPTDQFPVPTEQFPIASQQSLQQVNSDQSGSLLLPHKFSAPSQTVVNPQMISSSKLQLSPQGHAHGTLNTKEMLNPNSESMKFSNKQPLDTKFSTIDMEGFSFFSMMGVPQGASQNLTSSSDICHKAQRVGVDSDTFPVITTCNGPSLLGMSGINVSSTTVQQDMARRESDEILHQTFTGSAPGSPEQFQGAAQSLIIAQGVNQNLNSNYQMKPHVNFLEGHGTSLPCVPNRINTDNETFQNINVLPPPYPTTSLFPSGLNLENQQIQVNHSQNPSQMSRGAEYSLQSKRNVTDMHLPFSSNTLESSDPLPGAAHLESQPPQNSSPDLSTLIKQLSRHQVEDACPPALTLTPRGTGAGYGVGLDMDSLMIDAQETDTSRQEPSPLSSSLLIDWMDVTGNLNMDLEALEQELQSPMSLSYLDLNLYSS